ncbi:bursicon [Caerostris extrusa]|uniref:Bursicon n=1 Tax=Caerostris extrusa TaxID=172846 RepID=A0AAV4PQT6_CAEEX|nr:bursicon [Caerostris extrusa]
MKTKPYPKGRWDNLICALLISLHFTVILCRPPTHGTGAKSPTNFDSSISSSQKRAAATTIHLHHPSSNSIHSTQDLMAKFGDKDAKSANFIPSHLSDVSLSRDKNNGAGSYPFKNTDQEVNDHHYGSFGDSRLIEGASVFLNHGHVTDGVVHGPERGW